MLANNLPSVYKDGTASVTANGTAVTGIDTTWEDNILPGDFFGTHKGLPIRIAEVIDNTHLTLANPWPGAAQANAAYEIMLQSDTARMQESSRTLLQKLLNGNLDAFAGLSGEIDTIPMFTSPGAMTLIQKSDLVNGVNFDVEVPDMDGRDAYDTQAKGYVVLVANVGDGRAAVFFKNSNASGDWGAPAYVTGTPGIVWRGAWNGAASYQIDDAVSYGGASWISKTVNTNVAPSVGAEWDLLSAKGEPGDPGPPGNDGEDGTDGTNGASFVFRGAYSNAVAYTVNDVVSSGGSSWIAIAATTGNSPPVLPTESNAWWSLLSAKGSDGAGAGDVVGPASAVNGRIASFGSTSGKLLVDGGKLVDDLVTGPAASTVGRVASFADASGKVIADGAKLVADLVTGPAASVNNRVATFAGAGGKTLQDSGVVLGDAASKNTGTTSGTLAAGDDGRIVNAGRLDTEDQVLTGGARVTSKDLGTISTGTLTLDTGDRPLQHYTNNGAHTLAPGANGGAFLLDITNGASAGAITATGFTKVAGDAFSTTSGAKFRCHVSIGNGGSCLIVQALQ